MSVDLPAPEGPSSAWRGRQGGAWRGWMAGNGACMRATGRRRVTVRQTLASQRVLAAGACTTLHMPACVARVEVKWLSMCAPACHRGRPCRTHPAAPPWSPTPRGSCSRCAATQARLAQRAGCPPAGGAAAPRHHPRRCWWEWNPGPGRPGRCRRLRGELQGLHAARVSGARSGATAARATSSLHGGGLLHAQACPVATRTSQLPGSVVCAPATEPGGTRAPAAASGGPSRLALRAHQTRAARRHPTTSWARAG